MSKNKVADFIEIFRKVSILYISAIKDVTMKRTIYLFVFMLFGFSSSGQVVHNGVIVPESDSTVVQRRVAELRDSLNNRKFSDDMTKLRMKAEQLGNKTKEVIEGHTPVVKELMQSIVDYLKR